MPPSNRKNNKPQGRMAQVICFKTAKKRLRSSSKRAAVFIRADPHSMRTAGRFVVFQAGSQLVGLSCADAEAFAVALLMHTNDLVMTR